MFVISNQYYNMKSSDSCIWWLLFITCPAPLEGQASNVLRMRWVCLSVCLCVCMYVWWLARLRQNVLTDWVRIFVPMGIELQIIPLHFGGNCIHNSGGEDCKIHLMQLTSGIGTIFILRGRRPFLSPFPSPSYPSLLPLSLSRSPLLSLSPPSSQPVPQIQLGGLGAL